VLTALLAAAGHDLLMLSVPAVSVPAERSCEDVEFMFRRDHRLTSVAVIGKSGRLGLVSRHEFAQVMTGPLGYGRVLHARSEVGKIASWSPLVLEPSTGVVDAATKVVMRGDEDRWDDVLVRTSEGLRVARAAELLQGLAGAFAARASRDDLTGLPNRWIFFAQIAAACERTRDDLDAIVAVLYIDLDGFKAINDSRGHNAGDVALVTAARRLVSVARDGDVVARLGGDEFAVLLELPNRGRGAPDHEPAERAAALGERYRTALGGGDGGLAASVGVAICRPGNLDAETLLREADMAMYTAKNAGGNRVVVADRIGDHLTLAPDGHLEPDPEAAARAALIGAMHTDQLVLHYQPIVALTEHSVFSVEALVRWQHPTRGLLAPADFLPDTERLGLLADLDAWVLEHAIADYAEWRQRPIPRLPPFLNVNISRASLARLDLVELVMTTLGRHGVPAQHLRLKLVEDADTELLTIAAPQLATLRQNGVSLTWDDMGSGASALRHVTQVPVDGLKIDRIFINELHTSPSALAVVTMLIHLAAGLGATVTAEGVETPEQLDTLIELGADYAQGYHLARPAPVDSLLKVLASWPARSDVLLNRPPA
jgi:diguanylate cyclase (GGDEF)-like protein